MTRPMRNQATVTAEGPSGAAAAFIATSHLGRSLTPPARRLKPRGLQALGEATALR